MDTELIKARSFAQGLRCTAHKHLTYAILRQLLSKPQEQYLYVKQTPRAQDLGNTRGHARYNGQSITGFQSSSVRTCGFVQLPIFRQPTLERRARKIAAMLQFTLITNCQQPLENIHQATATRQQPTATPQFAASSHQPATDNNETAVGTRLLCFTLGHNLSMFGPSKSKNLATSAEIYETL